MGNIVGEPFKDYVAKQINVRQEVHGSGKTQNRTPEQIQYLNARNAWVKLASGTSMEQSRLEMIFGPGTTADNLKGTGLARIVWIGRNPELGSTRVISLVYKGLDKRVMIWL